MGITLFAWLVALPFGLFFGLAAVAVLDPLNRAIKNAIDPQDANTRLLDFIWSLLVTSVGLAIAALRGELDDLLPFWIGFASTPAIAVYLMRREDRKH